MEIALDIEPAINALIKCLEERMEQGKNLVVQVTFIHFALAVSKDNLGTSFFDFALGLFLLFVYMVLKQRLKRVLVKVLTSSPIKIAYLELPCYFQVDNLVEICEPHVHCLHGQTRERLCTLVV